MVRETVKSLTPQLIQWRRDFHRHPETAWTEFRTAALVIEHLQRLGFSVCMGADAVDAAARYHVPDAHTLDRARCWAVAAGANPEIVARMGEGLTGLWAELDCRQEGDDQSAEAAPLLAVRVDMDALPVQEREDEHHGPARKGFASCRPGHMHACGHDAHTALGLALAEALTALRGRMRGRIRFIFQPAEEGTLGATPMLKAGAVAEVNYLLGMHVGLGLDQTGVIACTARNFLATTKLDAIFHGRKAHASMAPQDGRNALLAACSSTLNLHGLPRHGQGDTRVGVGTLVCRHPRNVVPDHAYLALETRGATGELNDWMTAEATRVIKESASLWGCTVDVQVAGYAPHVHGDAAVGEVVHEAAKSCAGFTRAEAQWDLSVSEDFSVFLQAVQQQGGQGAYVLLGTPIHDGHHSPGFDLDEGALPLGLEVLVRTVLQLMKR